MNRFFGSKKEEAELESPSSTEKKDNVFGDVEGNGAPRRGSRIDAPRHGSIATAGIMPEGEEDVGVGKQMELEAENAIKYRTCSWQKVLNHSFPCGLSLDPLILNHPTLSTIVAVPLQPRTTICSLSSHTTM